MAHPLLAFLNPPELLIIMVVALVLFGGKRMPEIARGLGKTIREFKKATSGVEEQLKRAIEEETSLNKPRKKSSKKSKKTAETAAAVTAAGTDAAVSEEPADSDASASEGGEGDDTDYENSYAPYEENSDDGAASETTEETSEQSSTPDASAESDTPAAPDTDSSAASGTPAPQAANEEISDGGGI